MSNIVTVPDGTVAYQNNTAINPKMGAIETSYICDTTAHLPSVTDAKAAAKAVESLERMNGKDSCSFELMADLPRCDPLRGAEARNTRVDKCGKFIVLSPDCVHLRGRAAVTYWWGCEAGAPIKASLIFETSSSSLLLNPVYYKLQHFAIPGGREP